MILKQVIYPSHINHNVIYHPFMYHLSVNATHQSLVTLDQARIHLSDELHGCNDFCARSDVELFNGVIEDRSKDWEELRSQFDDCRVLLGV